METWMKVHEVMTRQQWEDTLPKPETFYERWQAASDRIDAAFLQLMLDNINAGRKCQD
jgi:hypothetical protein